MPADVTSSGDAQILPPTSTISDLNIFQGHHGGGGNGFQSLIGHANNSITSRLLMSTDK